MEEAEFESVWVSTLKVCVQGLTCGEHHSPLHVKTGRLLPPLLLFSLACVERAQPHQVPLYSEGFIFPQQNQGNSSLFLLC